VYENQRTIRAVEALKANDVEKFGQLMNESHVSLRDDYEVTGVELDTLVEEAWKVDGVIGSRMTGAGFGGCTVSIVKDEAIDRFIKQVGAAYKEKIGYAADFYVVEVGDGPCKL
jgi:galactokinase